MALRNLVVVLGDQLDAGSAAFDGFDPEQDAVWMAEVEEESTKVWCSKPRIALFLSAMRHFRDELRQRGWTVLYQELQPGSLVGQLRMDASRHRPKKVIAVEAGEWTVRQQLSDIEGIEWREDRHFLCSRAEFAAHARGRKQLRMEFFYREMRKRHGVLMDGAQPAGGEWNFDQENRKSFGKEGPPLRLPPRRFAPDALTREVIQLVNERFAEHPGDLQEFDWPVTAAQAEEALQDFVEARLPQFGEWQDAMWTGEPWLFHARLSAALNLKLLGPAKVIARAEEAWRQGRAPLAAVEGFIRQILGWREYVRGIYWQSMPEYAERNALGADQALPEFYWTGKTSMVCLREAIGQTLRFGYAHHIQRLMVTGLYALLLGVRPREVHEWYLAVYVDAVEWVELPNTLGMSQYADGGVMASKPYAASGKYIQRMSNYCRGCRFRPDESTGPRACPFTTLYWDFLLRHEAELGRNPRMVMQVRNLSRLSPEQRAAIQSRASEVRAGAIG
ncbi:MAG: deoxyribodipyrimidine photolyase-related protein [Verrucomicrobia bacterium]|nr:MAG: deoxyribodipyrimidine photolyase-related protein [Verrucomicrobiota bacterium]